MGLHGIPNFAHLYWIIEIKLGVASGGLLSWRCYWYCLGGSNMRFNMGVSINGRYPKMVGFMSWKLPSRNEWWLGGTPIWGKLHMGISPTNIEFIPILLGYIRYIPISILMFHFCSKDFWVTPYGQFQETAISIVLGWSIQLLDPSLSGAVHPLPWHPLRWSAQA